MESREKNLIKLAIRQLKEYANLKWDEKIVLRKVPYGRRNKENFFTITWVIAELEKVIETDDN